VVPCRVPRRSMSGICSSIFRVGIH